MMSLDFQRIYASRWHSWIAQPPPKGQVSGSNPLWDASESSYKNELQPLLFGIDGSLRNQNKDLV